jgi:enoyl-CoA hydratase/carnithine racemase
MSAVLRREQTASVMRLVLNDPTSRNSLSEAMMAALQSTLDQCANDTTVHVIVIAADGPVFCSGHNLKELTANRKSADNGAAYFEKVFGLCSQLMLTIANHPCPIIAEVDGLASAAGCQLVASCDLAYASRRARFCTPGVNIGLFCSTPMVPLSRAVPSKLAMEMLLTGDVHDAAFAYRAGLVNAVVDDAALTEHVNGIANKIASKSQSAIRYGKRSFYEQKALPLAEAYDTMSAIMVKNMLDGAACEGLDAFISKRNPIWPLLQ